jgi:hypothetical protein
VTSARNSFGDALSAAFITVTLLSEGVQLVPKHEAAVEREST